MNLIDLQLEIFLLTALGYVLSRKGTISSQTRAQMTSMVLSVFLPASIIQSFLLDMTPELLRSCFSVLIASILIQVLYAVMMKICWRRISDPSQKINLQYGTMVSNAGFMGMPISEAAYGAQGLLLASIFLIPQRVCMWSTGLALYTDSGTFLQRMKKVLLHPCIVALGIGVVLMLLELSGFHLPVFARKTLSACASCSTALSMMIIGAILADVPVSQLKEPLGLWYAGVRLILLPAMVWMLMMLVGYTGLGMRVCVLLCAMPAPSTMVMLAQSHHHDPGFASRLVFISTLLSLLTLPIWMVICRL